MVLRRRVSFCIRPRWRNIGHDFVPELVRNDDAPAYAFILPPVSVAGSSPIAIGIATAASPVTLPLPPLWREDAVGAPVLAEAVKCLDLDAARGPVWRSRLDCAAESAVPLLRRCCAPGLLQRVLPVVSAPAELDRQSPATDIRERVARFPDR